MQLIVATEADTAMLGTSDGFSDLIGKRALRRRRRSLEKVEDKVEDKVQDKVQDKETGAGSGHGAAASTEHREAVQGGSHQVLHPSGVPGDIRSGLPGRR
jgi:hypothetical protein